MIYVSNGTINNNQDNGFGPNRQQAIIWKNGSIIYRPIHLSLFLDEFKVMRFL